MRMFSFIATLSLGASTLAAQQQPVTPADYGKWESPGAAVLAPNGQWLAYGVNRVNEENELRLRPLAGDTTIAIAFATTPQFTADSRWLAYAIGVSPSERDRLTRERKPIRNQAAIRNIATGDVVTFADVASFRFSPDAKFIALRSYAPEGKRSADLVIRNLATGVSTTLGNITDFAWAPAGSVIALTIDVEGGNGNGVQVFDASTGALRVLDSSTARYRGLVWRDVSRDLAALRTVTDTMFRDTAHVILAWRDAPSPRASRHELVYSDGPRPSASNGAAPEPDMRVSETRTLQWSEDGQSIYFGLRPRVAATPRTRNGAADAVSDVQVWHGGDVRIIPQQKAQEQQDLQRTLLAVWHVRSSEPQRVIRIGTELQETARVLEDVQRATETDRSAYAFGTMYGRPYQDVWLIDTRTGERRKVLEKVRHFYGGSTTGRYLLWYDENGYSTYDVRNGTVRNLTRTVQATFANQEYDTPSDLLPPYGIAGWTRNDEALLVYDRYDIWSLAPDGSGGRKLTDGAASRITHRYTAVIPAPDGIDLQRGVFVSLFSQGDKKTGWARLRSGRPLQPLVFDDARFARLLRADSTDVYAFTRERFDDAPDWFVADGELRNARQLSALNPFQSDYAWGSARLVAYAIKGGRELQGVLLYPPNYDAAREYPMIVYTYELLSQNLHNYVVPSERSYYNFNVWTASDYLVLMPDIVYQGRRPGPSALEAVEAAVAEAKRVARVGKIGLVGHSWGGYQATYLPTRTSIFAAAVAGAPITNFLSFAGAIHWTPGIPEFSHWETGQARMDVPFWEDLESYLESSPAHKVHELRTPMLMMFGDADGTVDWHQGVEFYNFARRAGRDDFVLLVYPGEDHGLRKKENQIDYHRRINEWFGYWLKGEPAPKWITEGVTWLQRKEALSGR